MTIFLNEKIFGSTPAFTMYEAIANDQEAIYFK